MILKEGQVIRDTYEVDRFLGEGAFAEVYRVIHRFLGRQAMKVFITTGMTIEEIETIESTTVEIGAEKRQELSIAMHETINLAQERVGEYKTLKELVESEKLIRETEKAKR